VQSTPRKTPTRRDWRDKLQKIWKRADADAKRKFKCRLSSCPNCDEPKLQLYDSSILGRLIIYCTNCYSGDLFDARENKQGDYYHLFKDNINNGKHCFRGEIGTGQSDDFKKNISDKLEEMVCQSKRDSDFVISLPNSRVREFMETLNPYYLLLFLENADFRQSVLEEYRKFVLGEEKEIAEERDKKAIEMLNSMFKKGYLRAIAGEENPQVAKGPRLSICHDCAWAWISWEQNGGECLKCDLTNIDVSPRLAPHEVEYWLNQFKNGRISVLLAESDYRKKRKKGKLSGRHLH
jgi:hypothetical protein